VRNSAVKKIGKRVWRFFSPVIYTLSPLAASKILYRLATKRRLNLDNPKIYLEKLMWLKLFWQNPLVAKCADKYEVRQYTRECGYENLHPKLYGVYESVEEIEWDKFPKKFALKCTHGCHFNIICADRDKLDKNEAKKKLKKWMKTRYAFEAAEIQYDKMKPRIICEEYIETAAGLLPNDYKIYCFNGEPRLASVYTERNEELKLILMDIEWNYMDLLNEGWSGKSNPEKPACYESMLDICRVLAKPFPFVRMDFYDNNGTPVLGEMTFTPGGCISTAMNEKGLNLLGDMIKLPERYILGREGIGL
jgi:hypothetical protein